MSSAVHAGVYSSATNHQLHMGPVPPPDLHWVGAVVTAGWLALCFFLVYGLYRGWFDPPQ